MATLGLFVVGWLLLQGFSPDQTAFVYNMPIGLQMFARAFTHMVSHANWQHLTGNFVFGLPYMLYLETRLKSIKKFVRLFVCFGLAALAGQLIAEYFSLFKSSGMIGSSGAVFGMVALAILSFDGPRLYKYMLRAVLIFFLFRQGIAAYEGLSFPSGVGNAAHFMGIVAALVAYPLITFTSTLARPRRLPKK